MLYQWVDTSTYFNFVVWIILVFKQYIRPLPILFLATICRFFLIHIYTAVILYDVYIYFLLLLQKDKIAQKAMFTAAGNTVSLRFHPETFDGSWSKLASKFGDVLHHAVSHGELNNPCVVIITLRFAEDVIIWRKCISCRFGLLIEWLLCYYLLIKWNTLSYLCFEFEKYMLKKLHSNKWKIVDYFEVVFKFQILN